MISNKAEIKISTLFFGMIIISILAMAGTTMVAELTKQNPTIADSNRVGVFNRTFDRLANLTSESNRMQKSINSSSVAGEPSVGPTATLISSTWEYIKMMPIAISFIGDMFTGGLAASGIPFPVWFVSLIGLAITFAIGFVIFRKMFGGEEL